MRWLALLALLPGCSVAILGDSVENCERMNAAFVELAQRCGGEPQQVFCDVLYSDMTESHVDECVGLTQTVACGVDTSADGRCHFEYRYHPW